MLPAGVEPALALVPADAGEGSEDENPWSGRTITLRYTARVCVPRGCGQLQVRLTCPSLRLRNQKFPLLVLTGGFATEASQYTDIAVDLAASGCAVMRYDVPGASSATDETLVAALRSLLDFAASSPDICRLSDPGRTLLVGHSRGAKLSSLAAAADERVCGLCLLDPIDNTVWAPEAPGFPSACSALRSLDEERPSGPLPVAIVGAGFGGDCAPAEANYQQFFDAVGRPCWLLVVPSAGHAQFLDPAGLGLVQRAVCGDGGAEDKAVRLAAVTVCLAFAEVTCGPFFAVDADTALGPPRLLESTAAQTEIRRRAATLGGRSVSLGVAAELTVDWLRRRGVEVESSVKL